MPWRELAATGSSRLRTGNSHGRAAGFAAMVLDTLPSRMGDAVAMYGKLGFTPRAAYYDTPIAETIFLERLL